jgi:NADPH:quinone reductase
MPALIFGSAGDPVDVLRWEERPAPSLSASRVVVEVAARPINPADHAFIRGQYRVRPEFPQIAGLEGMGRILESAVPEVFCVGQRVAFRWPGSWAGVASVPVERLIAVPDDVDDSVGCQISLNPLTAWGLVESAQASAGDWLILTAATSTVANLIAAIGRARRMKTLGIVRGSVEQARPRANVDVILSASDPGLQEAIIEFTGGQIAALLDSVGGPLMGILMPVLSAGARILAYGVQDRTPVPISNAMLIYSNLTWIGFGIDRWLASLSAADRRVAETSLWSMIRDRTLNLPAAATLPLRDFRRALAADGAAGRTGKVLFM